MSITELAKNCARPVVMSQDALLSIGRYAIRACSRPGDWAVEIGAYKGETTVFLAQALLQFGCGNHRILSIDAFARAAANDAGIGDAKAFASNIAAAQLSTMVRIIPKPSAEAVTLVDPGFRFLIIDGSHRRANVTRDMQLYLPKLANGGIAWFHDYEAPERRHLGVGEAVDEYLMRHIGWTVLETGWNWIVLEKRHVE